MEKPVQSSPSPPPPSPEDSAAKRSDILDAKTIPAKMGAQLTQALADRKRAEQALRESEEQYRLLAENAQEAVYVVRDGKVVFANAMFARLADMDAADVIGTSTEEFVAPEDRARVRDHHRRLIAGEKPGGPFDIRVRTRKGAERWVAINAARIRWQGQPATLHFAADVTARKQAGERLRLHAQLLDGVRESVVASDLDGRIQYWGRGAEKLYGYKAEEVMGRPYRDFAGATEPPDEAAFRKTILAKGSWQGEHLQKNRGGGTFWTSTFISLVTDEQGRPAGFVGIDQDITVRKQAEEKLRDSEQQFKHMFESMTTGFALHEIILDAAGTPCDYRFLQVNPAFETLTGLKAEGLIGRTVREALPRTESIWIERYGRVALTGEPVTFENHSVELGRHYQVTAYRPQPGQFAVLVGDVTDRKRAEAALRDSEALYRSILNASPDDITLADLDGRILMVSPAAMKMFRAAPERPIVGRSILDFIAPADRERAQADVARMLQGTFSGPGEYRALRDDGTLFDIEVNGEFIRDESGQPFRMMLVARDVTERKRAEEAMRQSEEKFAQAFRISPYAITLTRADDGRFVDVNAAFSAITGFSREEALAHSSIGLGLWARPEDRQQVIDDLRQGLPVTGREYAFRAKSGRQIICLFSAQILRVGDDNCILSSLNDISGRKQAGDALRESELRHRDYLAHSPYGIFVADEKGRFVQVNPAACRITGYSEKELLSQSVPDLHGEDGREDAVRHFQAVLRDGKAVGELQFRTKSGEIRWWLVSAVRISDARFLGFCNDVTDRKQAEEQLRTSAERFQDIAANIPGVVFQLQTGRTGSLEVPYMSSGCEVLFGRPLRNLDFTGLLFDQMHLGDRALFLHSVDSAARKLEPWSLEFRIQSPGGSAKWLRGSANPRQTPQGGVLWNGVLLDITGLKQAEQSLREREAFQALLMDTIPTPVFYKDRQGRYLGFNKAFEALYGKTKEQLIGKTAFDVAPPELAAIYHEKDLELIQRPGTQIYEAPLRDAEGGLHSVVFHKASIVDAHGSVAGLIGVLLDVTERKRAEEKILQESLLNKTIIGSIPGTFYMLDEAGHYLRWNSYQQEQIVGQSDEGMRQTSALATIHPDDRGLIRAQIENVLRNGVDEVVEGRVLLRGGPDFRWLLMTGRRMTVDGRPAMIGIGIDITERKQAEEQVVRQLEELRRWQAVTLGRESRVAELKREVNALAVRLGQPPPYSSVESP